MKSQTKAKTLVLWELILTAVGLVFLILAFSLPFWVLYAESFNADDVGTTNDVNVKFYYGFWIYCSKITSNDIDTDTCATVKTSTDGEQAAACTMILAILLLLGSVINTCLYFTRFRCNIVCLYIATVSDIGAGVLSIVSIAVFGTEDHSHTISTSAKLIFSFAKLNICFWFACVGCVCALVAFVFAIIAIINQRNAAYDYASSTKLMDGTSSEHSTEKRLLNEEHVDISVKDSSEERTSIDFPFSEHGEVKKPFYMHYESDSDHGEDDLIFSTAPLSHGFRSEVGAIDKAKIGLKDVLGKGKSREEESQRNMLNTTDQTLVQAEQNKTSVKAQLNVENELLDSQRAMSAAYLDSGSESGETSEISEDESVSDVYSSEDEKVHENGEQHRVSYKVSIGGDSDMTPVESTSDNGTSVAMTIVDGDSSVALVTKRYRTTDDIGPATLAVPEDLAVKRSKTEMPVIRKTGKKRAKATRKTIAMIPALKPPKPIKRVKSVRKKKLALTKEHRKMLSERAEKSKMIEGVYGAPLIKIGSIGSHPEPRSFVHSKKPTDDVLQSGLKLMKSLKVLKEHRQKQSGEENDIDSES
ncbi:uncharacterized protein LOC127854059 [Dreissena polymorpha]|uniref:Uncharacterized protein n=1 Tax=Dreissena polymorpha TaxID=45954 RepID=A0A9D4HQZ2_DREPO|nr:uncharacterized protein LOC127854059 [Dreissena polymorpha]KAH3728214.1 hypothetical protein DPMN_054165 [Dreissena polymorpha]